MTGTHLTGTLASASANYTPIGVLAAIFVPICAAVAAALSLLGDRAWGRRRRAAGPVPEEKPLPVSS
jgi:hypothetical protein